MYETEHTAAPRLLKEPDGNYINVDDLARIMRAVATDLTRIDPRSLMSIAGAQTLRETADSLQGKYGK